MSKRAFCRHLVGIGVGCLQPFLIALCVCRCDGAEPFRVGTRKGEVELKQYKKSLIRVTQTRDFAIQLRTFDFSSVRLNCFLFFLYILSRFSNV